VWPSPEIAFVSPFHGAAVRALCGSPRSCLPSVGRPQLTQHTGATTAAMPADGRHRHHHQGIPPQAASRVRSNCHTHLTLGGQNHQAARSRLPTHPNQPKPRAVDMRASTQRPDGRSRGGGGAGGRERVRIRAPHAVTLAGMHHAAGCRQRPARARAGECVPPHEHTRVCACATQ
jgi:hypothetical protein